MCIFDEVIFYNRFNKTKIIEPTEISKTPVKEEK